MHELTICENLIAMLTQERRKRGFHVVTRLRLAIGTLSCLDPEALRYAFEISTRRTFMQGAVLEIDRPSGRAACPDCGATVAVQSHADACPHCGGVRLDPVEGDQMRLIEMEIR